VEALRRELLEETNLEVRDINFVLVQDCIHSKEFYRDAHFVLLNYTCLCAAEPMVKLNDEAREYRWVSVAEALAMPINQPTRVLCSRSSRRKGRPRPRLQLNRNREREGTDVENYNGGFGSVLLRRGAG